MKLILPEIFEQVEKAPTKEEKINILRRWKSLPMYDILKINFDPNVKFQLPEGEPPFKKDKDLPVGYGDTNLYKEARRFYIWIDPNVNLNKIKKETLFIQMLEGLHWSESELICIVKDKKLSEKYKSLTADLINEAFPGLLPVIQATDIEVAEQLPAKRGRGRPKKTG